MSRWLQPPPTAYDALTACQRPTKPMKRNSITSAMFLILALALAHDACVGQDRARRPNILFAMADDWSTRNWSKI